MPSPSSPPSRSRGFTLIELLVVVVIIGIISAFAVPAAGNLLKGSSLTRSANLLTDEMSRARQYAISRNRIVEVRFYLLADAEIPGEVAATPATGQFRAFQYFEIPEQTIGGSSVPIPVGKQVRLSDSVVMSSTLALSTLLNAPQVTVTPSATVDPELGRGVGLNYKYVAFRYLPDGTTNLSPTTVWFITIVNLSDVTKTPPPNFVTWVLDPVAGTSKILRPGGVGTGG